MDVFQKMVSTQAALFIYMVAGVICRSVGIINDSSRKYFNAMLTKVTLPCMIATSFLTRRTMDELAQAGMMLLYSAGILLAAYAVGMVIWRWAQERRRAILHFGTVFSNAGNAGLPVVSMVFGELGVLNAAFFLIPIRCFIWTVGLSMFMRTEPGESRIKKLLTNPCLLAVFVGLGLMLMPFDVPEMIAAPIDAIGDMVGPLSMMIIGSTLTEMKPRDMLDGQAWAVSLVRLIAIPLLLVAVLPLLGLPEICWQVAVTINAMPIASLTVVFAETHGGDIHFASRCVFISTLLSLVTVPLITLLF